jgi:Tfp pilus assembly protein PilN
MKPINFISTLSPQQQREIRSWLIASLCILIFALIGAGVALIPMITDIFHIRSNIQSLQERTKTYTDIQAKNQTLKKDVENLQKQHEKLTAYTNGTKNPSTILPMVFKHCAHTQLQSIKKHQEEYELTLLCDSPEQAQTLVDNLVTNHCLTSLNVTSLNYHHDTKKTQCVIKGK